MKILQLITGAALALSFQANATLINGDFENGLNGWTTYLTNNGTSGSTGFSTKNYDTDNDGISSNAFQVQPGQQTYQSGVYAGAGIYQSFYFSGGDMSISADIAAIGSGNNSGSLVSMFLDDVLIDSYDFAYINSPEYNMLTSLSNMAAGSYELKFEFTRPYITNDSTPINYLDDVSVSGGASVQVPEPSNIALLGLGLVGLTFSRRKKQ